MLSALMPATHGCWAMPSCHVSDVGPPMYVDALLRPDISSPPVQTEAAAHKEPSSIKSLWGNATAKRASAPAKTTAAPSTATAATATLPTSKSTPLSATAAAPSPSASPAKQHTTAAPHATSVPQKAGTTATTASAAQAGAGTAKPAVVVCQTRVLERAQDLSSAEPPSGVTNSGAGQMEDDVEDVEEEFVGVKRTRRGAQLASDDDEDEAAGEGGAAAVTGAGKAGGKLARTAAVVEVAEEAAVAAHAVVVKPEEEGGGVGAKAAGKKVGLGSSWR